MPAPIIYADQVVPVVGKGFGIPYSDEGARAIAQLPADKLTEFAKLQASDPVTYGWCFPAWSKLTENWVSSQVHVICGGNRSGKSVCCARLCIWAAMNIPGAKIRAWASNEEASINDMQRIVWNELPAAYKNLPKKRNATYDISYSLKNGFTGGKLVLPPVEPGYEPSMIVFQTYKSWTNDEKVAEGWWAHLVWADEEIPAKLYETLQYRLRDAKGRMLLSFTTISGWTPTVQAILGKAKTLEKEYAPLVKRELPTLQKADETGRTLVHYYWTHSNIFLPQDVRDGKDLIGKPEAEILARHYGVPTKSKVAKFPLFSKDVHVVPHDKIAVLKAPKKYTWFTALDPHGSRKWFMIWGAIDANDRLYITHEWPDQPTWGEWVDLSGSEGGKKGPATAGLGWGINDYKDLIERVEEEIGLDGDLITRVLDPRSGGTEHQHMEGADTIVSMLQDAGLTYIAAPGKAIMDGEALINDRLSYDPSKPVGPLNSPRLFISDNCQNLIQCMELYAGAGKDEPSKEGIDTLRYMLQSGVEYVDPDAPVVTGGGSY